MKSDKKILVVDFDGTLCYDAWPYITSAKQKLIHKLVAAYVRYKKRRGWTITLSTMREDKPYKDRDYLWEAIIWCADHGIYLDYANRNPSNMIKQYGPSTKIYGDIYIDDHNIGLIGWLLRRVSK